MSTTGEGEKKLFASEIIAVVEDEVRKVLIDSLMPRPSLALESDHYRARCLLECMCPINLHMDDNDLFIYG